MQFSVWIKSIAEESILCDRGRGMIRGSPRLAVDETCVELAMGCNCEAKPSEDY